MKMKNSNFTDTKSQSGARRATLLLFLVLTVCLVLTTFSSCGKAASTVNAVESDSGNGITAGICGDGTDTVCESVDLRPFESTCATDTEDKAETETPGGVNAVIHVEALELDRYSLELEVGASEMPMVTMTPSDASDKSELWSSDNNAVAIVNRYGNVTAVSEGTCTVTVRSADNRELFANVAVKVTASTKAPAGTGTSSGVTSPTYINGILVVNKTYPLPADYDPGVDDGAYAALMEMFSAASSDGISLWVASGYRSYATQKWLYANYVSMYGTAAADTFSARAGHSEHQTGLAFDLNLVDDSFAYTPAGKWIAENSWKYGFVIRYPKDKEALTGYKYEPWHVRYFGKDVSAALYESGLCLEEYLGISSTYAD